MNERVNECIEAHARRLERSSMAMMSFGHPTPRVVVVVVVAAVVVESFISPRGAGRPSRACFVFSFSTRRHQCDACDFRMYVYHHTGGGSRKFLMTPPV